MGIRFGHVTCERAYGPPLARMKARARHLADMPLSLSEKAELLKIWVAPVLYLTARA